MMVDIVINHWTSCTCLCVYMISLYICYTYKIVKYWAGKNVPSVSEVKVKGTVFIFTKDCIEQSIQFCSTNFLPFFRHLPQTFSIFSKLFVLLEQRTVLDISYSLWGDWDYFQLRQSCKDWNKWTPINTVPGESSMNQNFSRKAITFIAW